MSYRNWLVRPALFAGIGMTLFGNLDNAQDSWGGYLSHGWAPIAYLITFETLIRSGTSGKKRLVSGSLVLAIATAAMVISFNTLRLAAISWGWDNESAWLFPVIVDLMVIALSLELAWSKEKVPAEETLQEYGVSQPIQPGIDWEKEFAEMEISPLPAPVSPAPREIPSPLNVATEMARREIRSRSTWDVSRVAEMAVAGEPYSVAKETGIGQSTYSNVTRVAKLLRENPRADLSTAGKLPNGEVISAMRQLVKA